MRKPEAIFDRTDEWTTLTAFGSATNSPALGVVSGRRRHGKSFVLRHLVESTGGFYHQAIQVDARLALTRLGEDLARHLDVPASLDLRSWDAAIRALLALKGRVVVLDEYPYLAASSPELASVIQAIIDDKRHDGRGEGSSLILCGSSLSIMSGLLAGQAPLRGRATLDLVMRPFDFRTSAAYWGLSRQPEVAFAVDAILGGAPGYRDLMGGRVPGSIDALGEWLATGPLNPAHALFTEDDYLLREEPTITDQSQYLSVLSAIAAGNSTSGRIAGAVGRDTRSLHHTLGALERAGMVVRLDDVLRENRPLYRVADPIVRFCRLITQAEIARFELGRWREAFDSRRDALAAGVFGPHFEHLARVFTQRFADPSTVGGAVSRVGPAVLSDSNAKAQLELDVVVIGQSSGDRPRIVAIGEAKSRARAIGLAELQRLERARDIVIMTKGERFVIERPKLLLFSRTGFERNLRSAVKSRDDVELIDLARLYDGS